MTNAVGSASEPERVVESGLAKTRKELARRGDVAERADVTAPAAPDARGQLVDREA